jgi:hypothetical protein
LAKNRFIGATIDIVCPHCGRKTAQSLMFVQSYDKTACPWCRKAIELSTPEVRQAADEAREGARRRGTLSLFPKP